MINAHQFREAAKKFRAGRISLSEFNDYVFTDAGIRKPNEEPKSAKASASSKGGKPRSESDSASNAKSSTLGELLKRLNSRSVDSHKGDFGRVLAIGGAEGMAGAISLTGSAALRTGSGLVKIAVPEMIQGLVAANNPCLMTIGCAADGDVFHGANESSLSHHAEWADVVAIGPGMGRGGAQQWIVKNLYANVPQPMVVDADGLNGLADSDADLSVHEGQRILTPHPGEFCRLVNQKLTSREAMESVAKNLAQDAKVVVVLKGNKTYVTDGENEFRNDTGNPGMATAGSGDVLTGVITSLVGQGFSMMDAAVLGVNLHGRAGDIAAKQVGPISLIATDMVENLATAIRGCE